MVTGYELYELIAKGNIPKNTKFIDARNKVWKFDGAEFIKEIGDSDIYSDLEFARMDFEIIEDEEEIDIQRIKIKNISYVLCDKDFDNNMVTDIFNSFFRENQECIDTLAQAVKQLDKNIKELNK